MALSFNIGPSWTQFEGYSPYEYRLIEEVTSAPDPQSFFNKAYQRGFTDGRFHLLVKSRDRFPTGLLWDVVSRLEKEDIYFDVSKAPSDMLLDIKLRVPKNIELRDYQETAALKALEEGRGILSIATNGGKSYVAAALICSYDVPTVVLVARDEARKQMYALLSSCFGEASVATEVDQGASIVILTYTSAAKRDLSVYRLVIADEVHRVGADTFCKAAMSCENAFWRFGLSGTPMGREDGKDLYFIGATGKIIYHIDQQYLVECGYSATAQIYMIETLDTVQSLSRDWHVIEEVGIVNWEDRNEKIVEVALEALSRDKQVLIMVKRLLHGEMLRGYFRDNHLTVPFTNGKLQKAKRMRYYEDFKSRKCMCMIASGIYDDSIDVPDIEVLINGGGGKSKIATQQKLGRGLRNPGDKQLVMVDFWDRHHNILLRHSKRRKINYEEEGFQVTKVKTAKEVFGEDNT